VEGHSGGSNYFGAKRRKIFFGASHFLVVPTQFLMELGTQPSKLNNSNCHVYKVTSPYLCLLNDCLGPNLQVYQTLHICYLCPPPCPRQINSGGGARAPLCPMVSAPMRGCEASHVVRRYVVVRTLAITITAAARYTSNVGHVSSSRTPAPPRKLPLPSRTTPGSKPNPNPNSRKLNLSTPVLALITER